MATDDSKSMTIDDDDSDDNRGIYIFIVVMRFTELLINIFIHMTFFDNYLALSILKFNK